MAGRVNGQRRHGAATDLGQHVVNSRAGDTKNTCGQTGAGQQRNGRNRRTAFLEDDGEFHTTEGAIDGRHGEFGPAKVDDRLPHRAPALRIGDRLSRDGRRALGAQDVSHAVAQRQLTRIQSDVHKAPNIIKIVN